MDFMIKHHLSFNLMVNVKIINWLLFLLWIRLFTSNWTISGLLVLSNKPQSKYLYLYALWRVYFLVCSFCYILLWSCLNYLWVHSAATFWVLQNTAVGRIIPIKVKYDRQEYRHLTHFFTYSAISHIDNVSKMSQHSLYIPGCMC